MALRPTLSNGLPFSSKIYRFTTSLKAIFVPLPALMHIKIYQVNLFAVSSWAIEFLRHFLIVILQNKERDNKKNSQIKKKFNHYKPAVKSY